jgi:hypothetical protein
LPIRPSRKKTQIAIARVQITSGVIQPQSDLWL